MSAGVQLRVHVCVVLSCRSSTRTHCKFVAACISPRSSVYSEISTLSHTCPTRWLTSPPAAALATTSQMVSLTGTQVTSGKSCIGTKVAFLGRENCKERRAEVVGSGCRHNICDQIAWSRVRPRVIPLPISDLHLLKGFQPSAGLDSWMSSRVAGMQSARIQNRERQRPSR